MTDKTTESDKLDKPQKTDKPETEETKSEFMVYVKGIIRKYNRNNAHDIFGEIMAYIKSFCLLDEEYYITGSYAMGLKGIKQISNISVSVSQKNMGLILKNIKNDGKMEVVITASNGVLNKFVIDLTTFFRHNEEFHDFRKSFFIEIFQYSVESGYPNEKFSFKNMKESGGITKDIFGNYFMTINKLLEWKKELVNMNQDVSKHKTDIDDITKALKQKYFKYKNKYLALKRSL